MPAERKVHFVVLTKCSGDYGHQTRCLNVSPPMKPELAFGLARASLRVLREYNFDLKSPIYIEAEDKPAGKNFIHCENCQVREFNFRRIPPKSGAKT